MNKLILAGLSGIIASGAVSMVPAIALAQSPAANSGIVVTGKYQNQWEKGNRLEAEGLRDLEEAQRDLKRASGDVNDARNRMNNSQERGGKAEAEFRSLTERPEKFTDPDDALRWAKQVEEAARDWERSAERGDDREDSLDDESKQQRKAQKAVDKAQKKIASGRKMMAEAQRLSAGGSR